MVSWFKRVISKSLQQAAEDRWQSFDDEDRFLACMALSNAEAKRMFYQEAEQGKFILRESPETDETALALFSESVRDLFSKVARIEIVALDLMIDRTEVKPADWLPPGLLLLCYERNDEAVVLNSPGDGVFVTKSGADWSRDPPYPTIFHWLLCAGIETTKSRE